MGGFSCASRCPASRDFFSWRFPFSLSFLQVMRYALGGARGRGGGSRSARWRGKRRGGRQGGWDDGDGLFGEHYGARGFDCPPIVPTFMRTTAPSKGPSPAVPLLVPVSNLCAVLESLC